MIARADDHGPRSPATMPDVNITHMTIRIRVTKGGRLTLPLALCRKLGLDKMRTLTVLVEERDGGLFLRPSPPIRDIPKKRIKEWIARDEAEMAAFRAKAPGTTANLFQVNEAGPSLGEQFSELCGALRTNRRVKKLGGFGHNRT